MTTIGTFEAKTHLPALLNRVAKGETIIITKHGKPIARLVPAEDLPRPPVDDVIAEFESIRSRVIPGPSVRELIEAGRRH